MKARKCGQLIRLPEENSLNAQIFNSNLCYPPKERKRYKVLQIVIFHFTE